MKFLQNIKDGFTLAEVLITLVIVGVIAAMTIPTLMNNTNKQEYVSRLKKSYSTFAQATNRLIAENGSVPGWGLTNDDAGREKLYNMYKSYIPVVKECKNETGCFPSVMYKRLNGNNYNNIDTNTNKFSRKFVLNDGTLVTFDDQNFSPDCSAMTDGARTCIEIFVDINGAKNPNQWGRDLFEFVLTENGLVPTGCSSNTCNTTTSDGWYCACKVLREGAINY